MGRGTARGHMGTFLQTRGIFQALKYSQSALPFLCTAETSRSRPECQATDSGFTSHPGQRMASSTADPSTGLGLLRSREAGPRIAQRPKHQLATGAFSSGSLLFQQPATARERERESKKQTGRGQVSASLFPAHRPRTSGQTAPDQCPKVPVYPVNPSRWPLTQAEREGSESPFFRQELFPRGDNGSILFSQVGQGLAASGDLGILGRQTPLWGTKSAFGFQLPSPSASLPASP